MHVGLHMPERERERESNEILMIQQTTKEQQLSIQLRYNYSIILVDDQYQDELWLQFFAAKMEYGKLKSMEIFFRSLANSLKPSCQDLDRYSKTKFTVLGH